MEDYWKCPVCGELSNTGEYCNRCGVSKDSSYDAPKTIEELQDYCYRHRMPLNTMRFFVGENYEEAQAFGIYQEGDQFIVYKNKADGSRAVRYSGPDEAYAVNELFQKLLEECHNRGIFPDKSPAAAKEAIREYAKRRIQSLIGWVFIIILALWLKVTIFPSHDHDGYYIFDDAGLYYRYALSWYYDDAEDSGWYKTKAPKVDHLDKYYEGDNYRSSWNGSDFEQTTIWEKLNDTSTSSLLYSLIFDDDSDDSDDSDDYNSWDSDDTDWDSDW